jgi:hypothetical protein
MATRPILTADRAPDLPLSGGALLFLRIGFLAPKAVAQRAGVFLRSAARSVSIQPNPFV